METLYQECQTRMQKALDNLNREFGKLRTGRASSSLIEDIKVDYYGTPTPINQLASISIPDSRTISIQPWDRNGFSGVEKAILKSDLGLTPVNDGKTIRIAIPALTEERRKDLVKMAKKYTEEARVAIRNVRRDMNDLLKKQKNDKEINEDDMHRGQDEIQRITNDFIKQADALLDTKEQEIMEI
ncbi:ribosome recycling factor [Desulfoplanes formicivorans]|uniref:Ribosome-recycling factor n=1 Tax=Desulfoplanes formicivorans TaxID=1592317 RepID=A0A194ABN5_9BACT|nr:ribosome recycling factor [Desulfoplanes formicivorans]GAU07567.1 ribosome recycling factor [Desulfoplanes formicivorans]